MAREMKDSGVEWIGDIPKHWKKCKGLQNKPTRATDEVLTCFRDGEVTLRKNRREDGFTVSIKEFGYQGIDIGDLVVHGMDGFAGAIGISDSRGKASPVLNVLETLSKDISKRFLMYELREMAKKGVFLALTSGIRVRSCDTNWSKLSNLEYLIPPSREQSAITNFLDKKCSEIDNLTADIEKQISLLEDYKKSIITGAVTKGLNPNVEFKDSGIEWIGKIPKHWEITKIKNLGNARNGLTYSPSNLCDENSGTLVLRSSNIKNGKLSFDDNVFVNCLIKNNLKVKKGDILICSRNGSAKLIGKSALIDRDLNSSFGAFMMIFRSKLNTRYIKYILESDVFKFNLSSYLTSTINQLTNQNFSNMKIVFCNSEKEQKEIVDFLDKKCSEIDSLISDKKEQLEKLASYKQSMIYEYVTGKKEIPTQEIA